VAHLPTVLLLGPAGEQLARWDGLVLPQVLAAELDDGLLTGDRH
jgi:hypothetical protein